MRTTLTLDKDVAVLIEKLRATRHSTLKSVVNEALRAGLQSLSAPPAKRKPFVTRAVNLGKCRFDNLDNIQEILDIVDGPWRS